MPAIRLGLRQRVALALTLACLLVVGALGFTLYTASEDLEESLIDQILSEEMDYLVRRHREDPAYEPQGGSNLQSYIVRAASESARLPAFLRRLAPGRHELFVGADEYHVLVREEGASRYYVAYEVGLHEQREEKFRLLLLLSVLAAAVAAAALGYWLSGLLVQQVTELAERVADLGAGARRTALARPGQDPEVAMLARALENYQARIEEMVLREQEFTSNASHELRTPLAAIRTSCELLLAESELAGKARERVERIGAAADRMAEQIQALLELARGETPGAIEPVAIAQCVAEAVEPYRGEIAHKGLELRLEVADDAVLELDYHALRLVVSNLVRNAVHHTERGYVKISYAARRLTVADSGRGIEAERLPRVFERFYRGDGTREGIGLGLAIVKRVCDRHGWKIEVESAPLEGSIFRINFP
ncbi:MAG TPA: HAMP domain-containing sensor histidine kinase [Burkholderiales bacterium]|nr:HAMP domain-containing sensor histidine kinase [Burkholderiales bacterium]